MFTCKTCGKLYQHNKDLLRHKQKTYKVKFQCSFCRKEFKRKYYTDKNEGICVVPMQEYIKCPRCNKLCATAHGVKWHISHHAQGSKQKIDNMTEHPSPKTVKGHLWKGLQPAPPAEPLNKPCSSCCNERFDNRRDLYLHGMLHHYQVEVVAGRILGQWASPPRRREARRTNDWRRCSRLTHLLYFNRMSRI